MESSQLHSIESFSYSWLINLSPSLESSLKSSIDASDEALFIEMDPKMSPSKRFLTSSYDFNFNFPVSQSPLSLVHADELFSNGLITPLFLSPLKVETYNVSDNSVPPSPSFSHVSEPTFSGRERRSSMRRCRRRSKRFLLKYLDFKYLDFLWPLYEKIRSGRLCLGAADQRGAGNNNKRISVGSPQSSPRVSVACFYDDWRRSCDSESSIYEAVLHCKRSIEMSPS